MAGISNVQVTIEHLYARMRCSTRVYPIKAGLAASRNVRAGDQAGACTQVAREAAFSCDVGLLRGGNDFCDLNGRTYYRTWMWHCLDPSQPRVIDLRWKLAWSWSALRRALAGRPGLSAAA